MAQASIPHSPAAKRKIRLVMGEFHSGTLHSSSGQLVTNEKQAMAIALSKARRHAMRRRRKA